jgi:hypothetical protein
MTPTHDTAAALWSAIDAYGCDAASHTNAMNFAPPEIP